MNSRAAGALDVEKALEGERRPLAGSLRGSSQPEGAEPLAATLAGHAITRSVRGCAVCVIDGPDVLRVLGVAGTTGQLTAGSVWELAATPVPEVLAGTDGLRLVKAASSRLGRALHVAEGDELVGAPLRFEQDAASGPSALGALLLVRDRPSPLADDESAFFEDYASLVALALGHSRSSAEAHAESEAMASFLNLVVHDLRAPLTVLSGYVELLRDGTFGDGPPAWRKPLEMISAKLQETHRLVDDILLAARLESGTVPISREQLDLNDVIARAAGRSEARAGLAGARIESVPHGDPVAAIADPFQVDRIVDNLVNNAISYGGPSPWVRLSVDPADRPAIRVEDGGIGISPELHSRIFDRFFRVDNRVPGSGFGLHVGRVLAQACGGSLLLERSAPGEGSLFRLELPATAPS